VLERMMGYEIGGRDANKRKNWSMKQLSRTFEEGLLLLYGSNFFSFLQFCKTLGSPLWKAISIC